MNNPEISIIMPARDASKHIHECIDSIINQTEKNWELIIVNDHSTDNTFKIIHSYAKKDKRINVFNNIGKGIIDALSLAFNHSKGKFISRMDADDIMPKKKLEFLKAELIINGAGTVVTGYVKYFSDDELMNGFKRYEKWLNTLCINLTHYDDIYRECVVASPAWMMYRDDLLKADAFESNVYPEDYDLCFRWRQCGFKIRAVREVVHLWRDHQARTSRNDDNYSSHLFLDLKMHYFLKNDLDKSKKLVLWGAGKKGKSTAKILLENTIDFVWLCNNLQKVKSGIYGKKLFYDDDISRFENIQVMILVSNVNDQNEITMKLESLGKVRGKDFFFFC